MVIDNGAWRVPSPSVGGSDPLRHKKELVRDSTATAGDSPPGPEQDARIRRGRPLSADSSEAGADADGSPSAELIRSITLGGSSATRSQRKDDAAQSSAFLPRCGRGTFPAFEQRHAGP